MRPYLLLALFPVLACQLSGARADTVFKCVDADGSITYSNEKCEGKARVAKTITVETPPPMPRAREVVETAGLPASQEREEQAVPRPAPREAKAEVARSNVDEPPRPKTGPAADRKLEVEWPHDKIKASSFDRVCQIRKKGDRC